MNDRAFRLDFIIAIGALLISALTAATLIYQTHVIGDQFSATIWPYLSVGTTYDTNGETIEISNDGVGPALVRSASLQVDGRPLRSWDDYIVVLARDPALRGIFLRMRHAAKGSGAMLSMSSLGPSTTLRPGESDTLLHLVLLGRVPTQALMKHSVAIEACYCSLNGTCWLLHSVPGTISSDPQTVSHCQSRTAIESNPILETPEAAH